MPATSSRVDAPPPSDVAVAQSAALAAGREMLQVRQDVSSSEAGARGDAAAQDCIAAILRAARPSDTVLSDEALDDPARLGADRVWIIDPLDGTREFGEPGRVDWAVHVALCERYELRCGPARTPSPRVEQASRDKGDDYVNLALLTAGLRAEREQGTTIDVAYLYFATPRRKFVIADTPVTHSTPATW